MAHWHRLTEIHRHLLATQHHRHTCRSKKLVQHETTKHENKPLSKLPVAYKWYKVFIVCFASIINPYQDLIIEILLVIWITCITDAMFDVHEHLKKDACNITASLPPGDQNVKYKFSPGAKYGNKKPEKYRKKEIKNMSGRGSKVGRSAMGNNIFSLWCLISRVLFCIKSK